MQNMTNTKEWCYHLLTLRQSELLLVSFNLHRYWPID